MKCRIVFPWQTLNCGGGNSIVASTERRGVTRLRLWGRATMRNSLNKKVVDPIGSLLSLSVLGAASSGRQMLALERCSSYDHFPAYCRACWASDRS